MQNANSRQRLRLLWLIGGTTTLIISAIALKFGLISLSWAELMAALQITDSHSLHHALIWEIRLPRILTAMVGSSLLALSGLLMQNLFRNPLAGPSILGITSGSSLGVAIMTMAASSFGWHLERIVQFGAIPAAAFLGAFAVLVLVLLVSKRMADHQSLLIFGVMLGYFTSALITILQYKANAENIRAFVMWGMGSFAEVPLFTLLIMFVLLVITWILARRYAMALNCYLLGDAYAVTMGHDIVALRWKIIGICGLQVGMVTAYCGPIAFIGLTVPIMVRIILRTSDHRYTIPGVVILGFFLGIFSDQLAIWLELPLNAITAALGAPMIVWLLIKSRAGYLSL
jgi:iron complex transport system permease protein